LLEQIGFLQRRISILERRVLLLAAFCAALTIFVIVFTARDTVKAAAQPDVLTVKRLNVVDEKGMERVIIAAPVPDPMVEGKRIKRAGIASGILILDPRGKERGGYLTSDAEDHGAFLTLDSEQGQVFTAYANADSGATISLDNEKQDAVVMSTYKQPSIKIRQNKQVIFKQPPPGQ
jgi:hypothetical protein